MDRGRNVFLKLWVPYRRRNHGQHGTTCIVKQMRLSRELTRACTFTKKHSVKTLCSSERWTTRTSWNWSYLQELSSSQDVGAGGTQHTAQQNCILVKLDLEKICHCILVVDRWCSPLALGSVRCERHGTWLSRVIFDDNDILSGNTDATVSAQEQCQHKFSTLDNRLKWKNSISS